MHLKALLYETLFQQLGQIISEQNCGVLTFQKKQRNYRKISALITKMGPIKRHMGGFQLLDLIITKLKSHMTC